ncbi:aspartate carbamoyltransferase catalytic subunit [Roseovarius confluentis]|uniref:aspartate carbamoyltransferase catalytic subunit n=1 Tax=Roseovarius confluentis TaxID=1852027 RepID=UPI000CDD0566|nr:aspartate carbamoyltransferase catalytic subunit [Roseovarius confluentis]
MTAPQDEWEGILDPGEQVLWQGRPDPAITFRAAHAAALVFGLFFAGFALFWMVMAAQAGGLFWMFGLIHFTVGLGIAFGGIFWEPWKRRHTWYTLTDRRAFIARDLPFRGRTLKSYPITDRTRLEFRDGTPGSIMFDHEMRRRKNGHYRVDIGFERIAKAEEVLRLMRQVQERQSG